VIEVTSGQSQKAPVVQAGAAPPSLWKSIHVWMLHLWDRKVRRMLWGN